MQIITNNAKMTFKLLIVFQIYNGVFMMENSAIYYDSFLQRVSLQGINSSSSGIPLIMLKKDLYTNHAMCFPNSTAQQLLALSLAMCRQLGFDALQRLYSVDAHLFASKFHGKGLLFDFNCITKKQESQHCRWQFFRKIPCQMYLGVECTGCNYMVEVKNDIEEEIKFPVYLPCLPDSHCVWNIVNNHNDFKVTVLHLIIQNQNSSNSNNFIPSNSGQMMEVQWLGSSNGRWITIKQTFPVIDNVGPIKIESRNITVRYFSVDCPFFDPLKSTQGSIVSLKYYNEGHESKETNRTIFLSIIISAMLMGLFLLCVCYCIKKRGNIHSQHAYSMTYIPGFNLAYDKDDRMAKDTAVWTDELQSNKENQNSYFSTFENNIQNNPENEVSILNFSLPTQVNSTNCAILENDTQYKGKNFFSSLGDTLLHCFTRKAPHNLKNSSLNISVSSTINELDNSSSFEQQLQRYDSVVLSFQHTDSTSSVNSDERNEKYLSHFKQLVNSSNSKTMNFCSGQLLRDTKVYAQPLRSFATQLAMQYRKSSLDLHSCKSEEELYSCTSKESIHSCNSDSDSFNSINSNL